MSGNLAAAWHLGNLYGPNNTKEFKTKFKIDLLKSFQFYKEAADRGYVSAFYNVIEYFEEGVGVKKNIQKAIEYLKICAQLDVTWCQYNLAHKFYYGEHTF